LVGRGQEKTSYGPWDDEMYIASADGLYPGGHRVPGVRAFASCRLGICASASPLRVPAQLVLLTAPPPPGKMIVVDEEAIQVLQVTAGGAKKATKLLVKRACMGTRPTAHSFHAPVLAMPHMASYRPGVR